MASLFAPSLVASALLLAACILLARSGSVAVCWVSGLIGFVLLVCGSPVVLFQAVFTFLLALGCRFVRARPATVMCAAAAAALLSYGFVLWSSVAELRQVAQLREEYPLRSIADRLSYEQASAASDAPAPNLVEEVERRLAEREERIGGNARRATLSSLHDRTRDQFVLARGFGVIRMSGISQRGLDLPPSEPIPLPQTAEPTDAETGTPIPRPDAAADRLVPGRDRLLGMHEFGLDDFLNPERTGYVQDREHVAGFQPHEFTIAPHVPVETGDPVEWQLVRLELVSLLKHEEPVAYVSEHLPRMEELRNAPTRPLDGFEWQAMERLRAEEDLVIREEVHRIRMLGSIRAARDCLDCHSVRRGALLGAFSYELVPMTRAPVPMQQDRLVGPQARTPVPTNVAG